MEQFGSNDAHMPQEGPVSLSEVLININTGEAMSHLAPVMEGDNFEIVTFIATLHKRKKSLRVIEGVADIRNELIVIVLAKIYELTCI